MCARYLLIKDLKKLYGRFNAKAESENFTPNYNVAPTHTMPVITNQSPMKIDFFRWGLIPSWAKDRSIAAKLINARSETIYQKPSFRKAFESRRCLIPAEGFYEWKKAGKAKQPYKISLKDEELFAFAGLWETWHDSDSVVSTYTIITTEANELVSEIHDRMPVILKPEYETVWLDNTVSSENLLRTLQPYNSDQMKMVEVNPLVNSTRNNSPAVLQVNKTLFD